MPETKILFKQWTEKGEPAPKKAKTAFSTGKMMATVLWDSHGVILLNYLQKGKTITGAYYASLLDKLKAEIAKKWPHLQKKNPVSPRLHPKRLLFVPSTKNCARRTEIFIK